MMSMLEERIAGFARWRTAMVTGIESYKTWLDSNGIADIQQSLRIYDLIESLKHERMTLALLAEYSRGKTELINALLFGQYKRRILPSEVGRTTMSPTEIFHDPNEPPCIRLLPIETRRRSETIAALKGRPVEWIKISIDPDSESNLAEALRSLVQTKQVPKAEAIALGLYDEEQDADAGADDGMVEIPACSHALVNYPHPLLTSGLVILDTPGLNALGSEPELTMSMIPSAHAVLFLLAMDTGVTRSDLEVWRKHVQSRVSRRLAVLNKIDLLWDDIKTDEEIRASIDRQLDETARLLEIPRAAVLPISAKRALVARVRGDADLLEKSGIVALERLIADEIVPAKQEIMRATVQREIGAMLEASRQSIVAQFNGAKAERKSLAELAGKNRDVAQNMLAKLEEDRRQYLEAVERYRDTHEVLSRQAGSLLQSLSQEALDELVNRDRKYIEGAWSTAGLFKSMQGLFDHFTTQSHRIIRFVDDILCLVEEAYYHFQHHAGFEKLVPPPLNLEKHGLAMHRLRQTAVEFCHHPKQILTEKHFLVPNFYNNLVGEARRIFEMTRIDIEAWLRLSLGPLNAAITEHELQLNQRVENLRKLQHNLHSVSDRSKQLEQQMIALRAQHELLVGIRTNLAGESQPTPRASEAAPQPSPEIASANDPQAERPAATSDRPQAAA